MILKFLFKSMFKQWKNGDYQVVFWDNSVYRNGEYLFKFIFKIYCFLKFSDIKKDMFLMIVEVYMDGVIDIEGFMDEMMYFLYL